MPPLTRSSVTAASRIMLPTYAALHLLVGFAFLVQLASRTSAPIFDTAKLLAPIPVWGVVILALGVAQVAALLAHHRTGYIWTLVAGAGVSGFWSMLLFASAVQSTSASFTSGLWVAAVCIAQAASARSLASGEVR